MWKAGLMPLDHGSAAQMPEMELKEHGAWAEDRWFTHGSATLSLLVPCGWEKGCSHSGAGARSKPGDVR